MRSLSDSLPQSGYGYTNLLVKRFSKYSQLPWLLGKDRVGGMKATKLVYIGAMCFAAASIATSRAESDKSVTAAQVNGTWKTEGGEFKIWALGKQRLQVEFSGVYECKTL